MMITRTHAHEACAALLRGMLPMSVCGLTLDDREQVAMETTGIHACMPNLKQPTRGKMDKNNKKGKEIHKINLI